MGHPVLAHPAQLVADPTDASIRALVADMTDTLSHSRGVGLAAPQVGVGKRVILYFVPSHRGGEERPLTALINPRLVPLSDAVEGEYEACLSVPGLTGLVPRWRHVGYTAYGLDGRVIQGEAEGFHARVLQHECDHLEGRLYLSRMENLSSLAYTDELMRQRAAANQETPT